MTCECPISGCIGQVSLDHIGGDGEPVCNTCGIYIRREAFDALVASEEVPA